MALTSEQQTSHLSRLQQEILPWDYYRIGTSEEEDAVKPAGNRTLREVPQTFTSVDEYVNVFEPLVLEECAAQLGRTDDDEDQRAAVIGAVEKSERVNGFHVVRFALREEAAREFRDNDVFLLSKFDPFEDEEFDDDDEDEEEDEEEGGDGDDAKKKKNKKSETSAKRAAVLADDHPDAAFLTGAAGASNKRAADAFAPDDDREWRRAYALGFVDAKERKERVRVRFFLPDSPNTSRLSARAGETLDDADYARFRSVRNALARGKGAWYLSHLANMSTIAREWLALHAFPSLPFADTVMSGKVQARAPHSVWELPPPLLNAMNAAYNVSQVTALKAALEKQPITLIQGPPGTGKTRIILSLLSVILHAVPGAKSGHELELQRYLDVRNKKKPRTPAETSAMIRRAMPWLSGVANPRDAPPLPRGAPPPPKTPTEVPEIVGDVASKRTKVLVCAPSNSALDEIVLRIMQSGLFGPDGDPYSPTLVRVGVSWHHSVESVTMEALVNERQGTGKDANKDGGAAEKNFERALERDRAQIAILDEAAVVCSTLSFSGSGMFARMTRQFDVVVIDEAAQAVEPSTLVPLCYGAKQVFLVGDPRQLPATVLSSRATEYAYNQSLFKRFERCGYPIHVLKTQYRMHPAIREFPSARFYQNELEDGPRQAAKTSRPWHNVSLFRPFVFVDIAGKEYLGGGTSWSNDEEAHAAVAIATALMRNYPQLATGEKIGIISPYKAQVRNIRKILNDAIGEERSSRVDVNSIDGFQGREKEVCVFSVCRAPREDRGAKKKKTRRLGFVSDERRMNVGLTRARASLIVLGSGKALKASGDENWCALVNSARERDLIVKPPSASGRGDCTVADVKAFVAKITGKYDADDLSGSEDEIEIDDGDDALAYGGDVGLASGTTGASGGGGGGGGGGASTHVHRPAWERKIARRDDGDDVVVVGETKGAAAREGFSARGHVDELVTEAEGKLDDYGQGGGGGDDDVDPYAQEAEKPGKATKPRAAKRTRGAAAGAKGAEKAEKVEKTPPVKRTRAR